MADTRFNERLKRIEARHEGGARAELLAGVGEVSETRAQMVAAVGRTPRRGASVLLILLGALTGYLSYDILRDLAGLQTLALLPPEEVLALMRGDPVVGAAAVTLALCALTAIASFLAGRRAVHLMSFSAAATGAAFGAALPALA